MNFLQKPERSPDISTDDFEVSPPETIRGYFEKLSPIDRGMRDISEEWGRLLKKNELDELILRTSSDRPIAAFTGATQLNLHQLYQMWASYFEDTTDHSEFDSHANFNVSPVYVLNPVDTRDHSEPQKILPLSGSFSPSKKLVEIWIESVTALAGDAGFSSDQIAIPTDRVQAQQEFAKILMSLFGTAAQRLRYGGQKSAQLITKGGTFTANYEIQLCDRFFIRPSKSLEFLSTLRDELVLSLANGSNISGAWGRIELTREGDLSYKVTPPHIAADPNFIMSEEVE